MTAPVAPAGSFGAGRGGGFATMPVGFDAVPASGSASVGLPLVGSGSATMVGSLLQRRDMSHPSKCEITEDGNVVELDRAELHTALVEIFKAKHCNFVIKSDVEPDIVTANLRGMSIEGLLHSILSSVHQHLTYRRDEDGLFIVLPADK